MDELKEQSEKWIEANSNEDLAFNLTANAEEVSEQRLLFSVTVKHNNTTYPFSIQCPESENWVCSKRLFNKVPALFITFLIIFNFSLSTSCVCVCK